MRTVAPSARSTVAEAGKHCPASGSSVGKAPNASGGAVSSVFVSGPTLSRFGGAAESGCVSTVSGALPSMAPAGLEDGSDAGALSGAVVIVVSVVTEGTVDGDGTAATFDSVVEGAEAATDGAADGAAEAAADSAGLGDVPLIGCTSCLIGVISPSLFCRSSKSWHAIHCFLSVQTAASSIPSRNRFNGAESVVFGFDSQRCDAGELNHLSSSLPVPHAGTASAGIAAPMGVMASTTGKILQIS